MKTKIITTRNDAKDLAKLFNKQLESKAMDKSACIIKQINKNDIIVEYEGKGVEVIGIISDIISDYIMDKYTKLIINKIIKKRYNDFSNEDKANIEEVTLNNINKGFDDKDVRDRMHSAVYRETYEFVTLSKSMNIEGFVCFRLKEYSEEIEQIEVKSFAEVADAIDDSYIDTAKKLMTSHKPFYDTIHVYFVLGQYRILDGKGKDITEESYMGYETLLEDGMLTKQDLLVSALVTLAPKNLVLHGMSEWKDSEMIQKITKIFEDRYSLEEM